MTPIPLNVFADRLSEIFPVLMRSLVRRQADELVSGKITMQQFVILDYLYKEGAVKMTDLSNFMDVSTPAVTGIVDRLVKAGYVLRIFDPKDRRVIFIKIKSKGKNMVNRIHRDRRKNVLDIFGQISAEDRESYLRILNNVKDIVTKKI
jgi:DNA-binding MarR family transcriptional regulator